MCRKEHVAQVESEGFHGKVRCWCQSAGCHYAEEKG